jgi:hypothetical protein
MKANNVMKLFLCRYGMVLSILVCFGFHPMLAQSDFIFTGKVTEAASGEPIIGATVRLNISNANFGTATDLNGNYQFTANIAPGSYQLVASYVGFKEQVMTVDVGSANEVSTDFALGTDILQLDEIVVTGASVATSRKQLGNAISTLNNDDIENSGAIAVDQALSGKISGALVQQNSGDPAGGISIRLRGASTISGSSDPLYIIDGVLVNNSSNQLVDLGGNQPEPLVGYQPQRYRTH